MPSRSRRRTAPPPTDRVPACLLRQPRDISPPPYIHASTSDNSAIYTPILTYLIPSSASTAPIPDYEHAVADQFLHSYIAAFDEYPRLTPDVISLARTSRMWCKPAHSGKPSGDQAVFVKHWMPGSAVSEGGGVKHPLQHRLSEFLESEEGREVVIDDKLLTVAIVQRGETMRHFEIDMSGGAVPLTVWRLIKQNQLRIFVCNDKLVFFVALGGECRLMAAFMRWVVNWKSGGETVVDRGTYLKDWVYDIVRRTPDDFDFYEYERYLDRVQKCKGLNVQLRPYQERAVAWMLSRELGERIRFFEDIEWNEAKEIFDGFADNVEIPMERDIVINLMGKVAGAAGKMDDNLPQGKMRRRSPIAISDGLVGYNADDRWGCGGLLCDEMGLGKTVELMQLVLCNRLEPGALRNNPIVQVAKRRDNSCPVCEEYVSRRSGTFLTCAECKNFIHGKCGGICRSKWEKANYVCSKCCDTLGSVFRDNFELSDLPKSRATVVVIPTTLLHQWKTELAKHIKDALNVVIFEGLRCGGYVSRRTLMEADVVLTTYEALRADVSAFRALKSEPRSLRYARKYPPTPIPLLAIHWHRLALDESQMLGAQGATLAAEMAGFFHATYRWCVTGTPMSRYLYEAIPMLSILRVQGGMLRMNWHSFCKMSILLEDEKRLQMALRSLIWRSSKQDVEGEELQLPPQATEVVYASFGPVEKYHFESLQQSVRSATLRFRSINSEQSQLVSTDLLTMLRQACCHPQIGISGRRLMSHAARMALAPAGSQRKRKDDAVAKALKRAESPLDMNDVLDALVGKAKAECEEALRLLVAASNGLAAICLLEHSILPSSSTNVDGLVSAVQLYRGTLGLAEENKNLVRLDDIQKMHMLFNLQEALHSVSSTKSYLTHAQNRYPRASEGLSKLMALGSTVRDANLGKEIASLSHKYVADAEAQLAAAQASYEELFEKLGEEPLISGDSEFAGECSEDISSLEIALGFSTDESEANRGDSSSRPTEEGKAGRDDSHSTLAKGKKPKKNPPLRWWHLATASLLEKGDRKQDQFLNRLIQKLLDAIPGGGLDQRTLANRISNLHSLTLVLESELISIQKARVELRDALLKLPGSSKPTPAQVAESGQCRECREFGTGPPCSHCRAEVQFKKIERVLYLVRDTDESADFILYGSESHSAQTTAVGAPDTTPEALVSNVLQPKGRVSSILAQNQGGLRFQSETETVLKSLASALRQEKDDLLNQRVSEWFEQLESLKKEHNEARRLFESQRSLLARMDEVNMAVMRFSVLGDDEDVSTLTEDQRRHRLPRDSLPSLNVQFCNEKKVAEADFRGKRGGLVFLKGLQRSANSGDESRTGGLLRAVRNCAVCLAEFDEKIARIAVFGCGHVFCCDCTRALITRADVRRRISNVQCPTCRILCPVEEINFTTNPVVRGSTETKAVSKIRNAEGREEDNFEDEVIARNGKKRKRKVMSHSSRKERKVCERNSTFYDPNAAIVGLIGTKASAIVRTLRGIWQQEAMAKVLIFSEWNEVLNLISRALTMNKIRHIDTSSGSASSFSKWVDGFKTDENMKVLLLPLKKAGAGLNLTEAKHVILVEPSMNVSLEAQAVGRVHRIGQAYETFVHRVIIRDTVEEEVLALGDVFRKETNFEGQQNIKILDVLGAIHSEAESGEDSNLEDAEEVIL